MIGIGETLLASPRIYLVRLILNQPNYNHVATSLSIPERRVSVRDTKLNPLNRVLLSWGGHTLTGLGFIGMLLPVLPTTVFWIGAAICYAKSSPTFYHKLIGHKRFGKATQLYIDHGIISRQGKSAALLGMSFSALLIWLAPLSHFLTLAGILSLALAAIYVVSRPTKASVVR